MSERHVVDTFETPVPDLQLLGGFRLPDGIHLPRHAQRVIAIIAMMGSRPRSWIAGSLWPEADEAHAHASLRTAVWQSQRASKVLQISGGEIILAEGITIDAHLLRSAAVTVVNGKKIQPSMRTFLRDSGELLPGWYDDWVIAAREELQQLQVSALERLAIRQLLAGDFDEALSFALAAARIEPFRDSTQRIIIDSHLRAGNAADALRQYQNYAKLLRQELSLRPSRQVRELIEPLLNTRRSMRELGA